MEIRNLSKASPPPAGHTQAVCPRTPPGIFLGLSFTTCNMDGGVLLQVAWLGIAWRVLCAGCCAWPQTLIWLVSAG